VTPVGVGWISQHGFILAAAYSTATST
jgi:hypothetical protein